MQAYTRRGRTLPALNTTILKYNVQSEHETSHILPQQNEARTVPCGTSQFILCQSFVLVSCFLFSYFYEYTAIPFSRSRKNWNHTYFPLTSWTLAAVPSLPVKYCTGVYVFKCFILASCRNLKLSDAFSSTNSEFALKLKYRESDGHYCPTCQILGCSLKLGGRKGLRLRC